MNALIGSILGFALVFGPIFAVSKIAEKMKPDATVGEVGPWIIGIFVVEMIILLSIIGS